jgi:hypothetical protein
LLGRRQQSGASLLFETIARALGGDDVTVMQQAVQYGGGDDAIYGTDSTRTTGVAEQWTILSAAGGLAYVVAIASRPEGRSTRVAITITTTGDGADPVRLARTLHKHRAW